MGELRRREVLRTAAAYGAIAWLVIEIASVVVPVMGWPPAVVRWLLYVAVAGLPVSLLAAWFLDVNTRGIQPESAVEASGSARPDRLDARSFYGFVAGLLVASAGLVAYQQWTGPTSRVSVAEIELLARDGHYLEAYRKLESLDNPANDPALAGLIRVISDRLNLQSNPTGVSVSGRYFDAASEQSVVTDFGTTPLTDVSIARRDLLLHLTAPGYESAEQLVSSRYQRQELTNGKQANLKISRTLLPREEGPTRVPVEGGSYTLVSADITPGQTATLSPFRIDRYEVSNADYLAFVRAGGYREASLWDSEVSTEPSPAQRFTDQTGLPGPRGWQEQRPASGRDRLPVSGVSWYEADAYCRWVGGRLPNAYQWEKASRNGLHTRFGGFAMPWGLINAAESFQERANFSGRDTEAVDRYPFGQSPRGLYNTAGNVKEWLSSTASGKRVVTGGSWRDPIYLYSEYGALAPDSANDALGFRCASAGRGDAKADGPISVEVTTPAYVAVDQQAFDGLLGYYRYDRESVNASEVERVDTPDWTRLQLTYKGPQDESVMAYLWLPKRASAPYQTLLFVPHGGAFYGISSTDMVERRLGALIRDGRAAFTVVMKGMTGREWGSQYTRPRPSTVRFRDEVILHATELRLGIDYLEQRDDINLDALVYTSISWGAGSRLAFAAVDDRYRAVVLIGGGIDERVKPTLPEVDNVNFAPHISAPLLVVNGLQDEEHPWESRGLALWNLLPPHKERVLIEGAGHIPDAKELIPPIKRFLDDRFGSP